MLGTILHVLLFIAGIIGLLAVKQRRLRHIPTRRTHIPRRSAEGTIWLQRTANALLDMLHCALTEQNQSDAAHPVPAAATGGKEDSNPTATTTAAANTQATHKATPYPSDDGDGASDGSAEVLSELPFLNTLKAQLEEQISALLEDKGIASFADFRIKDWGGKPPVVKAVCLSHGGGAALTAATLNNSNNTSSNNTSGGAGGAGGAVGGVAGSNVGGEGALGASRSGGGGGIAAHGLSNSFGSASMMGSPNGAGPQHYPGAGLPSTQPPSSMAGGRGGPLSTSPSFAGAAVAHPHPTSPHPPPADRMMGEPGGMALPPVDTQPYSTAGMRYRSAGGGGGGAAAAAATASVASAAAPVLSSSTNAMNMMEESVARERSLASSMAHPSRGGNLNSLSSGDLSGGGGLGSAPAASMMPNVMMMMTPGSKNASDTTRSLSVLEAEVEVEYTGNFSVSLNADVPIARGRYLQVYASVSDVRMLAAHLRLRLALEHEPATVETPQPQPYLHGTLWLLSDPVFDVAFHSTLTQYRIRDFFLIPKLIKFFLLRFLRNKLRPASSVAAASATASRHANARRRRTTASMGGGQGVPNTGVAGDGAGEGERDGSDTSGLTFRVQLPADIVDGGEQWWSAVARDTMSERPAPFLRSHYQ